MRPQVKPRSLGRLALHEPPRRRLPALSEVRFGAATRIQREAALDSCTEQLLSLCVL